MLSFFTYYFVFESFSHWQAEYIRLSFQPFSHAFAIRSRYTPPGKRAGALIRRLTVATHGEAGISGDYV